MEKVSKGIIVTTSEYTKDFLNDCLNSIGDKYPIIVVSNGNYNPNVSHETIINDWNGFELGGIIHGKENFDEFIHLMDTCVIKDKSLFDKLFETEGNVFLTHGGYHYMGKFVSNTLPEIPIIHTKDGAIRHELHWLPKPHTYLNPDLPVHTDVFEEKFGQRRMKLENEYIIKWKGTFHI